MWSSRLRSGSLALAVEGVVRGCRRRRRKGPSPGGGQLDIRTLHISLKPMGFTFPMENPQVGESIGVLFYFFWASLGISKLFSIVGGFYHLVEWQMRTPPSCLINKNSMPGKLPQAPAGPKNQIEPDGWWTKTPLSAYSIPISIMQLRHILFPNICPRNSEHIPNSWLAYHYLYIYIPLKSFKNIQ